MPAGQPRASREALKGARTAAVRPQSKAQPVQPAAASNQLSGGVKRPTQQPAPAAEVAFTPTSQADCGAQISGQQAAMLSAAALPASTASSCQPSGGAAAAVSSCAQASQQRGGGQADASSPPAASAAPPAKGGSRRRAAAASVGKKRERDDPLCKAIERYLVAKTNGDGEDTPPSAQAQAQRVTRPRPSTAGRTKSASTNGTGDSASPLNPEASARAHTQQQQQQQQAGRALPHKLPQLHPKASTLSQGMGQLQLASPLNATGEPAAGAAASDPAAAGEELAGVAGTDGALVSAVLTGVSMAGQEAAAAVFAPLTKLQHRFASAQEQFVAQFGAEVGSQVVVAAELCAGNPWAVPDPLAPLTQQELEEARRQLAATAQPLPPGFKWVSPMPLSEEYFGAGGAAASAGAGTAAGGSSAGGGRRSSGSRLGGGSESGGGSGTVGGRGSKAPGTAAKRSKHVVPPYRLPAPVGGDGSGSQQAQQQRSGGSGGGRRYALRAARTKRRRDSGYVSLDSDLSSGEEESDIEYDDGEDEVEAADLMEDDSEDESEASRAPPAARQQPAAAAGTPSDALVRVAVTGAAGTRAGGSGRGRGRPPGSRKQQPAAQQPSADAAAAAVRSAAAAAGQPAGSVTPKVPTLGSTGLSPLLSPTLAALFMPADQGGSLPGPTAPIDLNTDLDHVLGDLDFSHDYVLHPQPAHREPSALLATAKAAVEAAVGGLPPDGPAPMVPQSALALAGSWPAAAVAAVAAAACGGEAADRAPLAPRPLLNPPLLSPPGGPLFRAASAPAIPTAVLSNLQPPRPPALSTSCSDFALAAPASSGGPSVSIGTHVGAAAAPPGHAPGADISVADVAAAAAALGMPNEKVDLAQVLGVKRSTPMGSPLLQGLMSPTALGQFFESWDGSGLQ